MALAEKQEKMRERHTVRLPFGEKWALWNRIHELEKELIREQEHYALSDKMLTVAFEKLTPEQIAEVAIEATKRLRESWKK